MVKKTLFIMTHLGSKWELLTRYLEQDARFQVFQTGASYAHPEDVQHFLTNQPHRKNNAAAVWVDVIFHNKDFTMKSLCKYYKFIFWSCPLENCDEELHREFGARSVDYWNYRMDGLRIYHQKVPESLWNPVLEGDVVLRSVT